MFFTCPAAIKFGPNPFVSCIASTAKIELGRTTYPVMVTAMFLIQKAIHGKSLSILQEMYKHIITSEKGSVEKNTQQRNQKKTVGGTRSTEIEYLKFK